MPNPLDDPLYYLHNFRQVLDWLAAEGQAHVLVRLQLGDEQLLARITRYSLDQLGLYPGLRLWAQIKSVALA